MEDLPETVVTEDVETLGQYRVLPLHFTGGASQRLLVFSDFFLQNLIHIRGHFYLLESFNFPLENRGVLVHPLGLEGLRLQGSRLLRDCLLDLLDLAEISETLEMENE